MTPTLSIDLAKSLLLGAGAVWAFYGATVITLFREIVLKEPKPAVGPVLGWAIVLMTCAFLGINGGAIWLLQAQAVELLIEYAPVGITRYFEHHAWLLLGHAMIDIAVVAAVAGATLTNHRQSTQSMTE